jgi:glycosyltransferase involved in cell wall biosynthesis
MYSQRVLDRIVLLGPANPAQIIGKFGSPDIMRAYGAYPFEQFVIETRKHYKEVTVISLSVFIDKTWSYKEGNLTVILIPQRPRARNYALDMYRREISLIIECLNDVNPDLVHAHWSYEYALAASLGNFPHLITVHDSPFTILRYYKNIYRFIMLLISIRVRMRTRNFIFVSNYLQAKWKRYYLLRGNFPVINNFTNIDVSAKKSETLNIVISIGDSSRRKNIKCLLKAWQTIELKFEGVELVLVGAGLDVGDPLQKWEKSKLNLKTVTWSGLTSRDGVLELLSRAVVMCHPSLEESQGLSLIEAMALGVPTISGLGTGGNVETVGGSGLLVDVRKFREISAGLDVLLSQPRLRKELSKKGRQIYYSSYRPTPIIELYHEIYLETVYSWAH